MKRKQLLTKTLLVMTLLCVGASNALAYDTPSGYGVSKVFIGTAGAKDANGLITTVSSEGFESLASLPSAWSANTINSISIENVTEVAKPAVDAVPTGVPTYVSGKTFRGYLRQGTSTGKCYAQYTLSEIVSSGKLVFSSELFESGQVNGPLILRFLDSSGNPVLTLRQKEKPSSGHTYYSYSIGEGDLQEVGSYTAWRTYVGMNIKDLVIDMTTGAASFTMDYIARRKINNVTDYYRTQTTVSGINIGTGKNIASVQIGKDAVSSTDLYFYMDNVELYKLDTYATLYSTIKAESEYSTKAANLDASGQAYWTANTAPTITTAAQYKAAVDALPTTYIAAVKAQTTKGSDMTDAMPTGNAGWTCGQGNGPASYQSTGATETYSDGGATYAKFATGNIMSQTITGLPSGYYKVQFYGVVNAANNVSTVSGSDLVQAYANSTNLDIDVVLQNSCTPTDYLRTIEAQVTDGTLTYGLKAKESVTDAGNWAVAKIYKLTYLGADKNTYTINAVAGETIIKELATGTQWASEDYGTYIPKAILYNSKYYVLNDEDNANLDGYYASYIMGATNETKEINYTLDESIVYYAEAENLTTSGHNPSKYGTMSNNSKYSSGGGVGVYDNCYLNLSGTVPSGVYEVKFCAVTRNTSKNQPYSIEYSDNNSDWISTGVSVSYKTGSSAGTIKTASANVTIPSTAYIRLKNTYGTNAQDYLDYVIIRKLNVNDDPVVVGDINNATAYLAAMTDKVTLKPGESYNYRFVNHNTGSGDATNNWILPVYPSGSGDATIALHANNYEDRGNTSDGCSLTSNSGDDPWDDFQNQMNGATIDMNVEYTADNNLNVNCDITTSGGYSWTYTYTSDYTGSTRTFTGDVDLALSVSSSWLEVLEKGYIGSATMKCGAGKYGTFAAPFDVTIPEGVTTYTASLNNAQTAIALEERNATTIPAGTPVIIYSENGLAETPLSGVVTTEEAICQSGILYGALQSGQTIPGGSYVLQTQDNVQQFYQLSANANVMSNVNRCWIQLPTEPTAKASLAISPDDITGVKSVSANAKNAPMKRIVNGQLVIEKDGKQYNAMGQEK